MRYSQEIVKYALTASRSASSTTDYATTDFTGGQAGYQTLTRVAVQVMIATTASMNLVQYYGDSTGNSSVSQLNSDTALTGGVLYGFIHMNHASLAWNYRFGTTVIVKQLLVSEFWGSVE